MTLDALITYAIVGAAGAFVARKMFKTALGLASTCGDSGGKGCGACPSNCGDETPSKEKENPFAR